MADTASVIAQFTQAQDVVQEFRELAAFPSISSGYISNSSSTDGVVNITSFWSQRDIDRKEKTNFVKTYSLDKAKRTVLSGSAPQEINNQLWSVESPSGEYRAVVRKQKDTKKDEDKQYIEIWSARQKLKTIDIKALDKHGDVVGDDGQFGSFTWSPSEGHLLYIAEKKKPKTSSFFEIKANGDDGDKKKGDETVKGEEFLYRETWGEQLNERIDTVICVLDVEAGTISVLESIPEEVSPGQVIWGPDEAGVIFVGWYHEPYRLGLKFCIQRKSFVYYLDFQSNKLDTLSGEGRAVRCPYLSPDQKRLVFLDVPEGGPHGQCSRLMMVEWEKRQNGPAVVVDTVGTPADGEFPGLYTSATIGSCSIWLSDSIHLVLPTKWRSQEAMVLINTRMKTVTRLQSDVFGSATSLLNVNGDAVLLVCSSPNVPHYLVYGTLTTSNPNATQWIVIDSAEEKMADFEYRFIRHVPTQDRVHPDFGNLDYESILYLPEMLQGAAKPPLIVFPHGGPHTAYDSSFALSFALFCRCGFAVLAVNYRGSLGFGQDSVLSLLNRIGDQDVKDCKSAADEVIAQGLVNSSRVLVYGGSHGGFLTTHLIGQYPDFFKAASTRNPVTNLTSMCGTSDIPDWVFTEAGLKFSYDSLADGTVLSKLWDASPIRYINQVKTPVMLSVGLKDLRVPPSQSMEYNKALRARGVPVKCFTYPNSNHSLSEVEVEADCLVNTILWFSHHLKQ